MKLTEREGAVAARYASGDTHKEIAARLHIAPATVRNHLAAIYRKLEVNNKAGLIRTLSRQKGNGHALPPPEAQAPTTGLLQNLNEAGPPPRNGASIAVMPFANIGPADKAHFGHGVAADIQHDLTRCHDLLVAGRSSCQALFAQSSDAAALAKRLGVQYLLQGTLRFQDDRIRLTAELVDGASGMVLWSERFDQALGNILEVEANVASAIVANLSLQIEDAQFNRRRHLTADQLTAYDLRLRGNRCLELGGKDNLEKAKSCFARALEREPNSAAAYAGLSVAFGYECDLLLAADYSDSLARHCAHAARAVALDESDSRAHYAMSCGLMLSGRFEQADRHAARAVELNPSEYHNLCNRGYSLMSLGRTEDSLACFDNALRRNPLAPNSCLLAIGLIEYLAENYGQSAAALSCMTALYLQRATTLAAACAQLGYDEAAQEAVWQFRNMSRELPDCPKGSEAADWQTFWRRAYPYLKPDAFARLLEGLGKAELPV